jgi:hypothetical protein
MPIKDEAGDSGEVRLRRWRVMEIEAHEGIRSRHVFGHEAKKSRGRASSPIIEFDRDTMTATTRSGSKYKLVGLPGNSRLGKGAWSRWCKDNVVVSEVDVTNEYLNIDQLSTLELTRITTSVDP